ncbi:STAS domain-containing protein [Streptomyces sp. NPDC056549]|uniref:STAS domain-containing protein n=1 Tax=Streptomyces sp. NPDC056549 TaxID=3345864 RepID=UPI0036BAA517
MCQLTGDIDIDTQEAVRKAFAQAARRAGADSAFDSTQLEFCDSTLLNGLIQLRTIAAVLPYATCPF